MSLDDKFMDEAIALAAKATGRTWPNPLVGCVIVKNGDVIGRGYHAQPGGDHAEVAAIKDSLANGADPAGAIAYVTLEPCNHIGRTGPCSEALINAGVTEVVFAIDDPNPQAAGGAERLRMAGVNVRKGPRSEQAAALNRAWLHSQQRNRPLVTAKVAMSLDGRIATHAGNSKWLTGPKARRRGHELRKRSDAILVGAGTIQADDPSLTARLDEETISPIRIVLDSSGATSPGAKAYERSGRGAILATTERLRPTRARQFEEIGVDVLVLAQNAEGRVDLHDLIGALHAKEIRSVMIEGGGRVLGAFLDADLIDELWLFYAPVLLGGGAPGFDGVGVASIADAAGFTFEPPEMLDRDIFVRGRRNRNT